MRSEIELLNAICKVQVIRLMDMCELHTYPKYRDIRDYEIRLSQVCLWHTNLWTSSKRRYVAEKLEKIGVFEIIKNQKHSPICIRFVDEKYNQIAFDLCKESLIGFNYVSGNGWNSYPQYTKSEHGIIEVDRISKIIYENIINDFKLS